MVTIRLMHAKLHRVKVTDANLDYIGSITIDEDLLSQVGILPLEEVDIVNLNNGMRWSTYALPGIRGSREICPNGGAALLCQKGDILIIYAYEQHQREQVLRNGHTAKVFVADENNNLQELIVQNLIPVGNGVELQSYSDKITLIEQHILGDTS